MALLLSIRGASETRCPDVRAWDLQLLGLTIADAEHITQDQGR